MVVKSRLNNQRLSSLRRDIMYEAIITDLALVGLLDRGKAKALLGFEIPAYLSLPSTLVQGENAERRSPPVKKASAKDTLVKDESKAGAE